ncbi:kinase-like domain-containing protein [Xylariaceae sp. FL0016]|nr:kinase-like domain-containing protein [Xylariaceae sp. FL0016]
MSSSTPNLTGDGQPLRSALKHEDESTSNLSGTAVSKAVQIAEPEPEPNPEENLPKRQFSAGLAKRLSGRPPLSASNSSRTSLISQTSLDAMNSPSQEEALPHQHQHRHRVGQATEMFVTQIAEWLEHERTKSRNRKSKKPSSSRRRLHRSGEGGEELASSSTSRQRTLSMDSQSSDVSLDRLQRILDHSMNSLGLSSTPHYRPGKKPQRKRSLHLHRTASSDTEYHDDDIKVPSCDSVLDNTKTLSYSGGNVVIADDSSSLAGQRGGKESEAWVSFKNEIIRLAHTLKLKGWRRVPLDTGETIAVKRLSGAMTNAIYVVSPPEDLSTKTEGSKKMPAKLLLRIYGPQVEHIIDRENELAVLKRLARKNIGPRLLGTFANGRFEQFLDATTLTAEELKDPETSVQISKRMRELHDGMELLACERDGGPAVWKAFDSWLDRINRAMNYLDRKISGGNLGPVRNASDAWKERGLVCGTEWPVFRDMVYRYREFVVERYGGSTAVMRDSLVFSHNDTQYGNILRIRPDDKKSPLLNPHYEHKQLVVIDFEYAAANVRGLEFANHFTEWCYNYHDEDAPFICFASRYPSVEEQRRFIQAYVTHRPEFPHPGASTPHLTPLATPDIGPTTPMMNPTVGGSTSSITEFVLDARAPPGGWKEEEKRQEEQTEAEIKALLEETRLWRACNSAFWVAWGIMQATIPGYDPEAKEDENGQQTLTPAEEAEGDPEAFDYLGYSQDRAMFFWGDCVLLGLVKQENLPEGVRSRLKFVDR